jgi:hypothetical protein
VGDEVRRRLERAAAAGDVEASAQLLVLRQRDGTLSWDRLVLASHLGDPAAQVACGDKDVPDLHDVARWAADNVGPEACARLARAAAAVVTPPERLSDYTLDGPDVDPAGDHEIVPGGHAENVMHLAARTVRAADPIRKGVLLERTLRLAREAFDDEALRRGLREVVPWLLS